MRGSPNLRDEDISRVLSRVVIHLGHWLPSDSSTLPAYSDWPSSNIGLFELAPTRVYLVSLLRSRSCRTYFLLHLSSPHGGWALPTRLPYGARTFLPLKFPKERKPATTFFTLGHELCTMTNE